MAATRFYFGSTDSDNAVSPAFDSNWEQTGEATRRKLYLKNTLSARTTLTTKTITIPITTTQDVLSVQFVGDPMISQRLIGTFSMVVSCTESASTANAHIAYSLRVCSQDGGTIRGTLASSFANATEFATSASTRIISAVAITALTCQTGDRLVLEVGTHNAAPTAATTATHRFGTSAPSDFALTSALTTDLNPWAEVSQDLFATINNFQGVRTDGGLWVSERVRA